MKTLSKNPRVVFPVCLALVIVLTLILPMEILSIIGSAAIGWHIGELGKWIMQQ